MNSITDRLKAGTVGEILVQLRLLEHGVQAAPPIKDSGNDLIAVRGESFRAIQVKTTTGDTFCRNGLDRRFHVLAVVKLIGDERHLLLDQSRVFLIPQEKAADVSARIADLQEFEITSSLVDTLFGSRVT